MTRYVTAVVGVLMFAFAAWAQSSPPQHQHVAPNVIDGAVHPELIPDSVAYRLYLVPISTGQNPTKADQERQRAHLTKTSLSATDQQLFVSILSDFRTKYDTLVADYNTAAKADATTDVHTLLNKLDDLIQSMRDAISVRLPSQGAARLYSFVVSEKKNMKVRED
jgi:hypothetical protein